MANIQEVFNRIQETKKEQKEIKAMYRDALKNSNALQDVVEEIKKLRERKKQIEDSLKDEFRSEFDKLETLKNDIDNDNMLLSDAALSQLMSGKTVEVQDNYDNKYEPIFSVRFKKV